LAPRNAIRKWRTPAPCGPSRCADPVFADPSGDKHQDVTAIDLQVRCPGAPPLSGERLTPPVTAPDARC
jgi:hypothetical protein